MTDRTLTTPPPDLGPNAALEIARMHFGLDGQLQILDSERDRNFLLQTGDGQQFVLKIANPAEDARVVDLQVKALRHLAHVDPALPLPRVYPSLDGGDIVEVPIAGGTPCLARLVSFLPGIPLGLTQGATTVLQTEQGALLARLGRALRGFFHPGAGHELLWNMTSALRLRELLSAVPEAHQRRRIARVLDHFADHAGPQLPGLRAQVIHNDLNPGNLLVDAENPDRITGIIDFGDLVHAPLVVDLAVAAAYQLDESDTPLKPVAGLVAAYHRITPLEDAELDILFDLIATRVAMSVVISSWRAERFPENEYILISNPKAVRLLDRLAQISRAEAGDYFRQACGQPVPAVNTGESDDQLIARRNRLLGPAYRLFYDRPLHFVRGQGVWLYDPADRPYLDCYNNVPHVGHCHPRVVGAIARQTARLNTHTRYLHRGVVDYAQRLAALFPFEQPVCLFCCSGSEASELAYRIAQAHTAGTGVVVTENAYHGNTSTVAQFSTADTPPRRRGAFVQTVSAPDQYRGSHHRGAGGLASYYAAEVATAAQVLQHGSIQPAMLLVDTIFSCDGIVTPPTGYLAAAAGHMRAAGGLVVADEVQAGFGRTGEHFWGFERHGVIPDIVTLGKPMGNGYPLAAVICSRRIVDAFAGQVDYFNTFGGNPVACAAGMAVLDVLEDENLQQNAADTGAYIRERLVELQRHHGLIGDVRGAGLFIGVELVSDRETLTPARAQAVAIVNAMREQGILIGATGPHGNVLKIRPPLVFSHSDADHLIETLSTVIEGR